jgi:fido (protein-threonine AMPylation protein)
MSAGGRRSPSHLPQTEAPPQREAVEQRRDHVRVGDSENRLEGVFRDPKTDPVFEAYSSRRYRGHGYRSTTQGPSRHSLIVPDYIYPDVDPDHAAIKNRLGVQTHDALEAFSAPLVAARISKLAAGHGPIGALDAAHLKTIHRHLFQDVYEWAGRTRDEKVRLADGTIATEPVIRKPDGKPFMLGARISGALKALSERLRKANYLSELTRGALAKQAADVMAAIDAIHAFREGNGRTQRALCANSAARLGTWWISP